MGWPFFRATLSTSMVASEPKGTMFGPMLAPSSAP